MSHPSRSPVLGLLAALALGACEVSEDSSAQKPAPLLSNLGLAAQASALAVDGDLLLVAASEARAGRDLNQDGDELDQVVFVVDLAEGGVVGTGLALDVSVPAMPAAVEGDLALFAASEGASGARDLNGDGDADDSVLFVHHARDGATRGLALALSFAGGAHAAVGDGLVAFVVDEAGQGADLDGDGERRGAVLFVYDGAARLVTNTRLAVSSPLFVGGGQVAFFADEARGDRNGDGDRDDRAVLEVFEVEGAASTSSGLATDGAPPVFAGGTWLAGVPEAAQRRDLDGDGELASTVVHAFVPAAGIVRSLRVACADVPCALAGPDRQRPVFALRVAETERLDLNGDGDRLDLVPHLYDPLTGHLSGTGIASAAPPVFADGVVAFLASEAAQERDLDGDGDRLDTVAFTADLRTAAPLNLRQEALALRGSRTFLLLLRRESAAGLDWNQDGDQDDVVVHAHEPRSGRTFDTGIAAADALGASLGQVLLAADEAGEGQDLNFDGDRQDQVFVLFDIAARRVVNLALAGGPDEARFGTLSPRGCFAFLASERAQGRDLDGDRDQADDVLHGGR